MFTAFPMKKSWKIKNSLIYFTQKGHKSFISTGNFKGKMIRSRLKNAFWKAEAIKSGNWYLTKLSMDTKNFVTVYVTKNFNNPLDSAKFLITWKWDVSPQLSKNSNTSKNNYRPVTVLSVIRDNLYCLYSETL